MRLVFRLPGLRSFNRFGLPSRFAMRLLRGILFELCLLLALVEGIFLAEKLAGIMEDAILNQTQAPHVLLMLLSTAPEIGDLALPMALLFAIYRVVLRLRESSELVVMAGVGVGVGPLLALTIGVAAVAQILALLISGYIDPYGRYFQRAIVFQSVYGILRSPSATGEFHFPNGYTVFARKQGRDGPPQPMLVHRTLDATTDRLVVARHWRLVERGDGWFVLQLRDSPSYEFFSAAGLQTDPSLESGDIKMVRLNMGYYEEGVSVGGLIFFPPRGASSSELTDDELWHQGAVAKLSARVLRSFLCLFAPLLALLAVAMTSRALYQTVMLPLAIAALMSIDVAVAATIERFMSNGGYWAGAAVCLMELTLIIFMARQIIKKQNGLLKPSLGST